MPEKISHLCTSLLKNEQERGDALYLRQAKKGQWIDYSWKMVVHQARQVCTFLYAQGLKKGDRVAISSKNCAEWFIVDFGILLAGMVSVPLFQNQNQENIEYILKHAEIQLVFVGKLDKPKSFMACIPKELPTLRFNYHRLKTDFSWQDILDCEAAEDLDLPLGEDIATIIYTSGTTGAPRGAVYDHQTIGAFIDVFPQDMEQHISADQYQFISYLPLAHVYERANIEFASIHSPAVVSFVESLEKFGENLREIKPSVFIAVPRIWEVFRKRIEGKVSPSRLLWLLKIPGIAALIKRKIKKTLGFEKTEAFVSGASKLPEDTIDFFKRLGIVIQEGYGQTENFAYATLTKKHATRIGYVGEPRIGVKIKKAEENELLIQSDFLMKEYYKEAAKTAETFTEDGWLRTGDIVDIDSKNRVKILGRLSEVYKNQTGEFVHPARVEANFGQDALIDNLCLLGQGLSGNVMLVNLSAEGKMEDKAALTALLRKRMGQANRALNKYEKISAILIITDEWTIDNNLLTPTLKVKRRFVESNYRDLIEKMLKDKNVIAWQKNKDES